MSGCAEHGFRAAGQEGEGERPEEPCELRRATSLQEHVCGGALRVRSSSLSPDKDHVRYRYV